MSDSSFQRLYHNPRCSKSREALTLLDGQTLDIKLYLENPPSKEELLHLFKHYDGPASDFLRSKEAKEFAFDGNFEAANLASFLSAHPKALQRPILVRNNSVIIARPPELVRS